MDRKCCIRGCLPTINDHLFSLPPRYKHIRKEWTQQIIAHNRYRMINSNNIYICQKHFANEDFLNNKGEKSLKPYAIPRIFPKNYDNKNEIESSFDRRIRLFSAELRQYPILWMNWTPATDFSDKLYSESIKKMSVKFITTASKIVQQLNWCITKFVKHHEYASVPWKYYSYLAYLDEMNYLKRKRPTDAELELERVSEVAESFEKKPTPKYVAPILDDKIKLTPRFESIAKMIESELNQLDGRRSVELSLKLLDLIKCRVSP